MSFWTAIVAIVAIIVISQVFRERRQARSADRDSARVVDDARERELESEVTDLKERIKVLERIAYDDRKRVGLADEIDSLRD